MASIDFDKFYHCPCCGSVLSVCLPIWITPGTESVDTGNIDYDSGNPQESNNWYCENCHNHGFPVEFAVEALPYTLRQAQELIRVHSSTGWTIAETRMDGDNLIIESIFYNVRCGISILPNGGKSPVAVDSKDLRCGGRIDHLKVVGSACWPTLATLNERRRRMKRMNCIANRSNWKSFHHFRSSRASGSVMSTRPFLPLINDVDWLVQKRLPPNVKPSNRQYQSTCCT